MGRYKKGSILIINNFEVVNGPKNNFFAFSNKWKIPHDPRLTHYWRNPRYHFPSENYLKFNCSYGHSAFPHNRLRTRTIKFYQIISLKGQCHEIFECWFSHQMASLGPIRGTLGRFWFLLNILGDTYLTKSCLSSVWYGTPCNGDSAAYHTPRNGTLAAYHTPWNGDSVVYGTPPSRTN